VLDWQTMTVGAPMWDVAYLIGTSLRDRKTFEPKLLQHYHEKAARHGYAGDADALRRDYRVGALCGFAVAVGSAMLVERTERGDEMFAVMAERPARHAIELESLEAL
jgi:aminoglycoside/choline kinase family phosphotransferase